MISTIMIIRVISRSSTLIGQIFCKEDSLSAYRTIFFSVWHSTAVQMVHFVLLSTIPYFVVYECNCQTFNHWKIVFKYRQLKKLILLLFYVHFLRKLHLVVYFLCFLRFLVILIFVSLSVSTILIVELDVQF